MGSATLLQFVMHIQIGFDDDYPHNARGYNTFQVVREAADVFKWVQFW